MRPTYTILPIGMRTTLLLLLTLSALAGLTGCSAPYKPIGDPSRYAYHRGTFQQTAFNRWSASGISSIDGKAPGGMWIPNRQNRALPADSGRHAVALHFGTAQQNGVFDASNNRCEF